MFLAAADTIISILEKNKLAISFAEGHRSARDFYIKNRNATPKSENILEALELIAEEMEITLTVEQFEEIVSLFPELRISLAVHGCSDSEVKGLILDAVFGFFTGCNYPQYKDRIDLEPTFRAKLRVKIGLYKKLLRFIEIQNFYIIFLLKSFRP